MDQSHQHKLPKLHLRRRATNGLGRRISMYATTLVQDEEYVSSQCRMIQL